MTRTPNIHGGGANTNVNGLQFERETDLPVSIRSLNSSYQVVDNRILKDNVEIALHFEKHSLYRELLVPRGVNYKDIISKKLLPDGAILVHSTNTLYVIEKKYQNGAGSVDEKLQTCDFKKKQYQKLLAPLNIKVEYYYLLNDWFNKDCYKDVFEYIESVGCRYFIGNMPLSAIGFD